MLPYPHRGDIEKTMEHEHVNPKVVHRLARIEGHISSVKRMVETGRDCSEVLVQIAAVRSALDRAGRVILEDHLEHCIGDALAEGQQQKAIDDLKTALKQFIG